MLNEDTRTEEERKKQINDLKNGVQLSVPLEGPKHFQIVNIGSITWAKVATEDIYIRTAGVPDVIHIDKEDELFMFYKDRLNKLRSQLASGLVSK